MYSCCHGTTTRSSQSTHRDRILHAPGEDVRRGSEGNSAAGASAPENEGVEGTGLPRIRKPDTLTAENGNVRGRSTPKQNLSPAKSPPAAASTQPASRLHRCRRHRSSFLAPEPEAATPIAQPIGGNNCHSRLAPPDPTPTVEVFPFPSSPGKEGRL